MPPRLQLLFLASLITAPLLAQVAPSATGGGATTSDDTQMMTPPPVSGLPYANTAGAETRSNYLEGSFAFNVGYIDNVLPGGTAQSVSDINYSVSPNVSLEKSTSRQKVALSYSPIFTFYHPTSVLDTVDQSASLVYQNRLSAHLNLTLQNFFMRTNNVFNESYPFSTGGLTGSTQAPVPALIAPFAEQMTDTASGSLTYQFGRNGMIGGGGSYSNLDFPNPAQAIGLSNSSGEGATAFYSRRLSRIQYGGLSYQYSRNLGDIPYPQFEVQTHTVSPFYTVYFNRSFSLSASVGIQRVSTAQAQTPTSVAWSPSMVASLGWQGQRGSIAASYLHTVTAGQGLYGSFHSDTANASGNWKLGRTWSAQIGVSYTSLSVLSSLPELNFSGGDTLTAQASLSHRLGEHLSVQCGYDRLHENYSGVAVVSANPDSDLGFVALTYTFRRPLGR
jgi:hypothetical protein